jgi:deazaflavin-dependent oxidoreductase (nitroreductase family)
VVSAGAASDDYVTLEVTGRKSGRIVSFPLVMIVIDGQRYLVSMFGNDAQWVRNVRAASGRAILRSDVRADVHLDEVPDNQRAPILKAYLQLATGAQPHMPVNKDAALAEFEKVAAAFPVFRVASNLENWGFPTGRRRSSGLGSWVRAAKVTLSSIPRDNRD